MRFIPRNIHAFWVVFSCTILQNAVIPHTFRDPRGFCRQIKSFEKIAYGRRKNRLRLGKNRLRGFKNLKGGPVYRLFSWCSARWILGENWTFPVAFQHLWRELDWITKVITTSKTSAVPVLIALFVVFRQRLTPFRDRRDHRDTTGLSR